MADEPKPIDWLKVALALRDRSKEFGYEAMQMEKSPYADAREDGRRHQLHSELLQSLAVCIEKGVL